MFVESRPKERDSFYNKIFLPCSSTQNHLNKKALIISDF